jgi:RimJ/RimL family protein N-acetyltransferase
MCGDVNLFFNIEDDHSQCEMEIMIAEAASRRGGIGSEAVLLMMVYGNTLSLSQKLKIHTAIMSTGARFLGVTRYYCKIGESNSASLAMFERIGYTRCNYAEAFKEVSCTAYTCTHSHTVYSHTVYSHTVNSHTMHSCTMHSSCTHTYVRWN